MSCQIKINTNAETQGVNSRNRYDKFTTGLFPIAERQPRTKQRSAGSEVPNKDFESRKVKPDSKGYKSIRDKGLATRLLQWYSSEKGFIKEN